MDERTPRIPEGNNLAVSAHPWRKAVLVWILFLAISALAYRAAPAKMKVVVVACAGAVLAVGLLSIALGARGPTSPSSSPSRARSSTAAPGAVPTLPDASTRRGLAAKPASSAPPCA